MLIFRRLEIIKGSLTLNIIQSVRKDFASMLEENLRILSKLLSGLNKSIFTLKLRHLNSSIDSEDGKHFKCGEQLSQGKEDNL